MPGTDFVQELNRRFNQVYAAQDWAEPHLGPDTSLQTPQHCGSGSVTCVVFVAGRRADLQSVLALCQLFLTIAQNGRVIADKDRHIGISRVNWPRRGWTGRNWTRPPRPCSRFLKLAPNRSGCGTRSRISKAGWNWAPGWTAGCAISKSAWSQTNARFKRSTIAASGRPAQSGRIAPAPDWHGAPYRMRERLLVQSGNLLADSHAAAGRGRGGVRGVDLRLSGRTRNPARAGCGRNPRLGARQDPASIVC